MDYKITPIQTEDLLSDLKSPMPTIFERVREAENELIKKILSQLLKRDVTIEDAKRLTIVTHPDFRTEAGYYYGVAFDGVECGKVFVNCSPLNGAVFGYKQAFSVTFVPTHPL